MANAPETVLIVNPSAGNGSTGKAWPRVSALVQKRLGSVGIMFTDAPGDAVSATKHALQEGARRIVCVGGDGTLNEVVNGFMAINSVMRRHRTLGFIPIGTGCDFARTVAVPRNPELAIDAIGTGHRRPLDIGRLWIRGHQFDHSAGLTIRGYFLKK